MDYRDKAAAVITAQQEKEKEKGRTPAWMVGEQLKDICRREPKSAELIVQDMANEKMHIQAAAGKIKAYADEQHRKNGGNAVCVTPAEAEEILRKFYGLPEREEAPEPAFTGPSAETTVNLEDFL